MFELVLVNIFFEESDFGITDEFKNQKTIVVWRLQALKLLLADQACKFLSNEPLFISNGGQEPELRTVFCSQIDVFHVYTMLYQNNQASMYWNARHM